MDTQELIKRVCELLGNVTPEEIKGRCREYRVATARQLVMWYMARVLKMQWTDIGRELGRNHATAIYGVRQADIIIERNRSYDRKIHDAAMLLKQEHDESKREAV